MREPKAGTALIVKPSMFSVSLLLTSLSGTGYIVGIGYGDKHMSTRYTYAAELNFGGDTPTWEGEAVVSYTVAWGRPAQTYGPAERCYPADPDEVDDIRVETIDGRKPDLGDFYDREFCQAIIDKIEADHWENLIENAAAEAANDAWDRADYERDARIDDRLMGVDC
jgi:hypothetical protein